MRLFVTLISGFILFFSLLTTAIAQQGFNYQAAIRNIDGTPLADSSFTITAYIVNNNLNGAKIYYETHEVTTNSLGLINLIIGNGETSDNFNEINWSEGNFSLGLEINGHFFSLTPLLSVPYSMHAYSAGKIDGINDPSEKSYTDSLFNRALDAAQNPGEPKNSKNPATKNYVDSALAEVNNIDVSTSGDTLKAGTEKLIIPGLSALNKKPYNNQKCFGGTGNETIRAMLPLDSGQQLVIAETDSKNGDVKSYFGMTDIWLFVVNDAMEITRQTTIGGKSDDQLSVVKQMPNGNLLLSGTSESNDGSFNKNYGKFDVWFIELNPANLKIVWSDVIGGTQTEFVNDIVVFNDNSFIAAGSTFSEDGSFSNNYGITDIWAVKYDYLKTKVWTKIYGDSRFESLNKILKVNDQKFFLIGETESNSGMITGNNGGLDILILEIDGEGNLNRQSCIGTDKNEESRQVHLLDNNIVISGISFDPAWNQASTMVQQNVLIATIDAESLTTTDYRTAGGSQNEWPAQSGLHDDGNLLIFCSSNSSDDALTHNKGDYDFWILNTSSSNINAQNFGGDYAEHAFDFAKTETGYLFYGTSESNNGDLKANNGSSDIWVLETDNSFKLTKQVQVGGSWSESVFKVLKNDATLTIFGTTQSNDFGIKSFHGKPGVNNDIWIIKTTF